MLKTLHIENIAVIEKADIEFDSGMNVLTGETGAGKSIVIDALGAVLGGRVSRELVRTGETGASVTAVFSSDGAEGWCAENGIEPEDGELFIMRSISAEGKSKCRVNGVPVSAAQLKALGETLLDIHGQNDGQRLLNEKYHREFLDNFGGIKHYLDKYKVIYKEYRDIEKEKDRLSLDEGEKERRTDSLRFQIEELERGKIKPGEYDEKSERRRLLKNSGRIADAVNTAFYALFGGDSGEGAVGELQDAERAMENASEYSEKLKNISEKLTELRYSAEDLAEELRDIKDSFDFSPQEMDELDSRLSILQRLMKKYGGSEEEMLLYLDKCREELDTIEYSGELIEKLEKKLIKKEKELKESASELTKAREEAAKQLSERILKELEELSMRGVQFRVSIEPTDGYTPYGADEVSFLMSANMGERPGKISRIASGGELSRIMLAMKSVLAETGGAEAMVFDEIDTGVSGIAAQRVGEKLSDLAGGKQVICVTHLPQIAAMADRQFVIEKGADGGRTYTRVTALDLEGRKREISRLIGGENITELSLKAAAEQLSNAERYKSSGRGSRT